MEYITHHVQYQKLLKEYDALLHGVQYTITALQRRANQHRETARQSSLIGDQITQRNIAEEIEDIADDLFNLIQKDVEEII